MVHPYLAALFTALVVGPCLEAGTVLYYDSVSGGTPNALDRLDSQTDANFIASSPATSSLGSNAVFSREDFNGQTHVQGLGDGIDKSFRFGSGSGGTGTMAGPLRVAHMVNGPYLEVSFTAAQDLILSEFSCKLWNNSNNASSYAARDAGLFVKVSSEGFSQFGELFTSSTSNGNQGTVIFSDAREVAAGDVVTLRLTFTDRTRTNNDNQAATRIGAINISALPGPISDKLRILTYNIHGGKGPNNEGTPLSNLTAFRNTLMQNEDILCLQEVDNGDCWAAVQSVFADYPHLFRTVNQETDYWFWETPKQTSIVILSKYPFVTTHQSLVQTDPTVDKWERRAQHMVVDIGGEPVDIFHYHNTYNFETNDWEYEKSGMEKFRNYVLGRLGLGSLSQANRLIMLGDFNLLESNVSAILPTPQRRSNGRDHLSSIPNFTNSGSYAAVAAKLSDHPAVWASFDLAPPSPNPAGWESPPAELGANSVTMTASAASDPNGVEYYFTNTSIPGGSHDSGWQTSPTFTDLGLSPATSYTYTVSTRDKSNNGNLSSTSIGASATTDDGDPLPNDWELQYFPSLSSSTGGTGEDWDKDGSTDFDEWVAGTDPTDPASRFHAWIDKDELGNLKINWTSVSGKTYRVMASPSLDSGWGGLTGDLPATEPVNNHSIPNDLNRRFFMIEVKP